MSFPFDPVGNPAPQTIGGSKEPDTVLPGSGKLERETAIQTSPGNPVELGRTGVNQPVGPDSQGPVDIGEPEHRQAGDDFGDLGAERRHFSC